MDEPQAAAVLEPIRRDARGRILPGQRSFNPHGRPRGFRNIAKMIAERTRDGEALVDFAVQVFADERRPHADRWQAQQWLAAHLFGKPDLNMHVTTDGPVPVQVVVAELDGAALREQERALEALLAAGVVIDVPESGGNNESD